jgi:hypothetical protein
LTCEVYSLQGDFDAEQRLQRDVINIIRQWCAADIEAGSYQKQIGHRPKKRRTWRGTIKITIAGRRNWWNKKRPGGENQALVV